MNKILICSAVAAALSANAQAEKHNKDNEKWVAGFVEYYSTDKAETGLPNFLDNGYGAGAEYGFKFTPGSVSYTHFRAHETKAKPVCRLMLLIQI